MYFLALVLFLTIEAAVGQTPNCLVQAELECGEKPMKDIPTTAEELKTICKAQQEHVKCKADFFATCYATVRKAPMEYRYLENLKKGCDENNVNYEVTSRNMGCIAPNIEVAREICNKEEVKQNYTNFLRNISVSVAEGRAEETAYCSFVFPFQTCASLVIGKLCGEELENPVSEMIKNLTPYFSYFCAEDIFGGIEPHLGALRDTLRVTINALT